MNKVFGVIVVMMVVVAAGCGGDSESGLSDDQQAAVDMMVSTAGEEGIEFDEDCLSDVVRDLSDDGLDRLLGADGDDLGPADLASTIGMVSCMTEDSLVTLFVDSMADNGVATDEDCVRDTVQQFDVAEVFSSDSTDATEEMNAALMACATGEQ